MRATRIVIADDDAVIRLDLRSMLEDLGHEIVGEVEDGESAVGLARSLRPDLAILDVMMPRCTGIDAAEIIGRERLAPVLLLTAYSEAPLIDQANRAGVLAYLVKPFRQQELQPAIAIAISRYREMVALEGRLDAAQDQIESARALTRARRALMDRHRLTEQEAHRRLVARALALNRSIREVSEAILLAEGISPL